MEEIEHKLSENNAVSIVQAITKLVKAIKEKKISLEGKNASDNDITEFQLLKSKCCDENATICVTASQGIVSLVEEGVLLVGSTLSDLIVSLTTAKCFSGIILAIGNLLLVDLRRSLDNKSTYKCPFSLQKNQHPLITVLSQNKETWLDVHGQMQMFIQHFDDKITSNSIELLRPVFFFILCKPVSKLCDTSRRHTWSLLTSVNDTVAEHLSYEILSWIQITTKQDCLDVGDYLKELSHKAARNNNSEICSAIILYLSSLIEKIIRDGGNPISYIRTIIDLLEIPGTENTHSVVLMIFSECIVLCPPLYLKEILRLCNIIISKQKANVLATRSVICSLLQWLIFPSNLLTEALKIAKDIINFAENNDDYASLTTSLYRNSFFKHILASVQIDMATKQCLLAEKWQNDKKYLYNWLDNISENLNINIKKVFNFLSAIFIHGFGDPVVRQKSLNILLKIVKKYKEYASNVIVLIIFKLSNERDPETQVALFKALPQMAVLKENIALILTILDQTKKENGCLKSLTTTLYLELFLTEVRTYPYLEKVLLEASTDREFNTVKAQTLKQICIEKPELHGKEMVGHLAQILNKHGDQKGSLISALAIDGITALCEAEIIDIISTWSSLAPKFSKDKRPLVINSLCNFFAGFANLRVTSKDHEYVINEVISKLWQYASTSTDVETIGLALKALSSFEIDQITLKQLPELYRQNLVLPSSYAKTPTEAARKPEDVLPYIPGECWIQLLQNMKQEAIQDAGNTLIEWIHAEISAYKSGIYIVADGKTEPLNYKYLPAKSIVRGIGNAVQVTATGDTKSPLTTPVLKECLRILGQTYPKPLPPLNWCFLHDLFHKDDEIKKLCINLACKQILLSGSALRFLENYISTFEASIAKVPEIIVLLSNLTVLCKGIAPNLLRPLLTNSLQVAFEIATMECNGADPTLFNQLADCMTKALLVEDIHDANRTLIGQVVENFSEQMDGTSDIFDNFLDCIAEIPSKYMERISSPSLWWEVTEDKFERAVKVRCKVAKKSEKTPFVWLNECVTTATTLKSVQVHLLRHIVSVFQEHCTRPDISDWLLELMGQVQEHLTHEIKDQDQIVFLCDIFLLAVIVLTGHECLVSPSEQVIISREVRLSLFPNALFDLVREKCQTITVQIMEWLYHMITSSDVYISYQKTFFQSLVLLRHEKAFIESSRWMKYMSVKYPN